MIHGLSKTQWHMLGVLAGCAYKYQRSTPYIADMLGMLTTSGIRTVRARLARLAARGCVIATGRIGRRSIWWQVTDAGLAAWRAYQAFLAAASPE